MFWSDNEFLYCSWCCVAVTGRQILYRRLQSTDLERFSCFAASALSDYLQRSFVLWKLRRPWYLSFVYSSPSKILIIIHRNNNNLKHCLAARVNHVCLSSMPFPPSASHVSPANCQSAPFQVQQMCVQSVSQPALYVRRFHTSTQPWHRALVAVQLTACTAQSSL